MGIQKMSWKKNELGKKYRHNGVKYFAEVFTKLGIYL